MIPLRSRLEAGMANYGRLVFRNPYKVLTVVAVLTIALVMQMGKLSSDNRMESFLEPHDPTRITFDAFRRQFGRDEMILLMIEPREVFSREFLIKLREMHEALEREVPYLDEVTSLVNARETRAVGDVLQVGELLKNWEASGEPLESLRRRVLANPVYRNLLVSEDGRYTAVLIKTLAFTNGSGANGAGDGAEDGALSGFDEGKSAGSTAAGKRATAPAATASVRWDDPVVDALPVLDDKQNGSVVAKVREIVERYRADDFRIYAAGGPIVQEDHRTSIQHDMQLFVQLSFAIILVTLFLLFRRVTGVVLPVLIVALSVLGTLGAMGLLGYPMRMTTSILPSFLLVVGVADAVHLLTIFYRRLDESGAITGPDGAAVRAEPVRGAAATRAREEALAGALGHSGLAVILTTLTTAVGLASFYTAELVPVADLGIFGPVGVILALLYTLLLLPALLAVLPLRPARAKRFLNPARFTAFLAGIARFSTTYPRSIVAVSLLLIAVSLTGVLRITFSHDILKWLPQDYGLVEDTERIDEGMRGATTFELVVDTGRVDGLYDLQVLQALDRLGSEVAAIDQGELYVGATGSVADVLKEIHRALNENRQAFYTIPDDPAVVPQEFLLFENSGSDDLQNLVDSQFRVARFTFKVPYLDAFKYLPLVDDVKQRFSSAFEGKARVTLTGGAYVQTSTLSAAIHSMATSYLAAGAVISLMMLFLIGSLRAGLLSLVPNILPLVMVLGFIGWFQVRFDMFTMLVGTMAMGIVVDDTIHFMHNFRRYYEQSGDAADAVLRTLTTAGRAIIVTSLVLALGFFVYMASSLNNLFLFGLFTGATVLLALAADLLTAPALMVLAYPSRRR